jgi:GNAT superfamily N-acetyltransferase
VRSGDVVSLRVGTPAGLTEVVGTLVAASPTTLSVRRRDGRVVEVAVDSVQSGRVVPPGPAQRVDAFELQAIMARGWRAIETADAGGWLLRAAGGFTGRANSALVPSDAVPDLPGRLEAVRRWYAERNLPAKLQVVIGQEPPGLVDLLERSGWTSAWRTHTMTAEVAHVLRAAAPPQEVSVRLDRSPDEAWLTAYRNDEGPMSSVAVEVIGGHPDVVFASVRDGHRCLAVARVAVDGRWAGLSCVEVDHVHRRRGLAQAVTAAALRWAVDRGARRSYLQVVVGNESGTALWERLAYRRHHDYVYWTCSVER